MSFQIPSIAANSKMAMTMQAYTSTSTNTMNSKYTSSKSTSSASSLYSTATSSPLLPSYNSTSKSEKKAAEAALKAQNKREYEARKLANKTTFGHPGTISLRG